MKIENKDNVKNNLYYSDVPCLDFDNLELMFLYIENYKQFRDFSLNLNAKYLFEYNAKSNTLKIKNNSNYIQLYPQNVNLKILCGKNGVGKTNIINILQNIDNCKNAFIVYKTSTDSFITNKKDLKIFYNKKHILCSNEGPARCGKYFHLTNDGELIDIRYDNNFQADFCRGYLNHYKELNKVLNKQYKRYFNYFNIGCNDIKNNADYLEESFEFKYNIPLNPIGGLGDYFRKNPIKFIMLNESFDSSFDYLHEKYKKSILPTDNKDIQKLFDKILKNIYGIKNFKQIENLNDAFIDLIYDTSDYKNEIKKNKQSSKKENVNQIFEYITKEDLKYQKQKEYLSGYYKNYIEKLNNFSQKLNDIYNEPIKGNLSIHFYSYFYFNLFRKTDNGNIYFLKLSVGEQQQYITILNLYYKLEIANSLAQTLIFEDDIDANLHPEWCRQYINMYISAIKAFSKNKEKIRNIILATHSPFVLSDTTNDYIEYLEKDKKNKEYTKLKGKNKMSNTFAGNIMQMFEDNMFLDASIGAYSMNILKEVVNYLDKKEIVKPVLLKKTMSEENKYEICKNIIYSIGDNILCKILQNKYFGKNQDEKIRYCEN